MRSPMRVTALALGWALSLAGAAGAEGIAQPRPPTIEPGPVEQRSRPEAVDEDFAQELYDLTSNRPEELKQLIHEVLCTYIENPDSVRVAIELGSPIERLAGRIRRVEVALEETVIKKLPLTRGLIILEDIVLDLPKLVRDRKFRFRDKGTTSFLFEVTQDALNSLLREKEHKLKVRRARLRLENDRLVFSGKLRVLFFNQHVKLDGRLLAKHGTQVHFDPRSLHLDFLPIPPMLLGILKRKINPLADLKNFRFNVDIGTIRSTQTRLMLGSSDVTGYIDQQVRLERRGDPFEPIYWPPEEFSTLLARGQEVLHSDSSGGATLAERLLEDRESP